MILKNGFFLLTIILHILFLYKGSTIIFPFKITSTPYLTGYRTDKNNININTKENYNSSQFFDDNYILKILSLIKLGTPPKQLISQIELYQDYLLIKEFSDINFEIFNKNQNNKGYQYKESSSFKDLTAILLQNVGEDDLFLFRDIKDLKEDKYSCLHKIRFEMGYYKNNDSAYNSLSIGLNLDNDSLTNFIKQLYEKRIISSLIISFEYNLENIIKGYDGILILGEYPHQIMNDTYKEEDLVMFYSNQPSVMRITNFFVNFDEINSIGNNKEKFIHNNNRAILSLNSGLILGTVEYLDFIENNFFLKYMKLNICQKYTTNTGFISDFIIISCDKNDKIKFDEFPNLNFYMKEENLIFEFSSKDLFKEIKNKYYFLVVFETKNLIWRIGKPLLSKYTFVYNGEAKTLGFYKKKISNKNLSKEDTDKNIRLEINIGKIFIFFILFSIFIVLIIFISYHYGKKKNFKRKKFANELDDDNYDYNPSETYQNYVKDINGKNFDKKEKQLELINKIEE